MSITPAALKTEITTDPMALGLTAAMTAGNFQQVANLLNAVGAGANYVINVTSLLPSKVFSAIVQTELAALAQLQLSQLQLVLGLDIINPQDANTRTILGSIFPSGSATRTALLALATRQGSRAEVLGGAGTVVAATDVSNVR
jgi:hypothetical protein